MQKKALLVIAEGTEETEAVATIDILRRGGIEVTVAALHGLKVRCSRGVHVLADTLLKDVPPDYDAVIIPGGGLGAKNLAASPELKNILITANAEKKIIAAICASPAIVLAPLGILDDKQATCYPDMFRQFSPSTRFRDAETVVDGNIITSQGMGTTNHFALAILEKLSLKSNADNVKKAALIK